MKKLKIKIVSCTVLPYNLAQLEESPDGLHPSVTGYRQMSEAITDAMTTGGIQ